ncbi:MAG: hypothetical protein AAF211_13450, partial [Myxococcota bacterium]
DRRDRALAWLRESPESVERWIALAEASPHAEERRWARTQALDRDPAHPLARLGEARSRWLSGDEATARSALEQLGEADGYATDVELLRAQMDRDAEALARLRERCPTRSDVALAWADLVPADPGRAALEALEQPTPTALRRRIELEVQAGTVDPTAALPVLTSPDPATRRLRGWLACLEAGSTTTAEIAAFWARRRTERLAPGAEPIDAALPDCPVAWTPLPEPEPFVPPEVGGIQWDGDVVEILVVAEGPDALRERILRRLDDLGYRPPRRKGDRLVFRSDGLERPKIVLRDDGTFDIVPVTVVPPDPENPVMGARIASPRQRIASRARLFDAIGEDLRAWRRALFDEATEEGLGQRIGRTLREIWEEGQGPDGALPTPEGRRAALLTLWGSKSCTGLGDQARQVIEAYLDLVVMASSTPFTAVELAETAASCGHTLSLYGAE